MDNAIIFRKELLSCLKKRDFLVVFIDEVFNEVFEKRKDGFSI